MMPLRKTYFILLGMILAFSWGSRVLAQDTPKSGFKVLFAETQLMDHVVRLNAGFEFNFSPELIEALENGVPITLNIEMEIFRSRNYWRDDGIARVVQKYRVTYSELTRRYVLDNLNSGTHFTLPSLDSVLWVISGLSGFPLLDRSLLRSRAKYYYRIRLGVDVDSLPVPLRVMAYISSRWHLTSDWYTWPLAH